MSLVNISDVTKYKLDDDRELLSISAFSELVETHGKDIAEKIIQAHYVWLDPSWTRRRNFTDKKRKDEAEKMYLSKTGLTWDDVKDFTDFYRHHCLTDLERELESMELLVQERSEYFHKLNYEDNGKTKDSMAKTHPEFVAKVKELRDLVSEEKAGSKMRGGYQTSLVEGMSVSGN